MFDLSTDDIFGINETYPENPVPISLSFFFAEFDIKVLKNLLFFMSLSKKNKTKSDIHVVKNKFKS